MTVTIRTQVEHPLCISSRLMAALRIPGVGTLHLHPVRETSDRRVEYGWVVDDADGRELGRGEDLRSGCGAEIDYNAMMASLLGFLTADAERSDDDPDGHSFPPRVVEWARHNSDELTIWGIMLVEGEPDDVE